MAQDSDVFVVRGSLQLVESEMTNPTIQKTLWGTGTTTITADRDYWIVGIKCLQAGSFALSLTNVTTAQIGFANGTIYDVIAAMVGTTFLPDTIVIRNFWKNGQKLYYNTSSGTGILLILEPA